VSVVQSVYEDVVRVNGRDSKAFVRCLSMHCVILFGFAELKYSCYFCIFIYYGALCMIPLSAINISLLMY